MLIFIAVSIFEHSFTFIPTSAFVSIYFKNLISENNWLTNLYILLSNKYLLSICCELSIVFKYTNKSVISSRKTLLLKNRCWGLRSTTPQRNKRHSQQCKPQSEVYFQPAGVRVSARRSRFQ
jgi:hypothetical protein